MSLERKLDTENRYLDMLGNPLAAARLHLNLMSTDRSTSEVIANLKEEFYEKLTQFISSGYKSTKKINQKNLDKFYRYRLADWTNERNFQIVEGYFYSLYSNDK